MNTIDVCAIVASNRTQAAAFRALLDARIQGGLYPREIQFVVLSDPEQGRVGSGGGTLLSADALRAHLARGSRVLLINAGGESRRMPAYAAEGKLFAPVPVRSAARLPPVLLDLQLSLFQKYPWTEGELVVSSGDVVIDFETGLIPNQKGDIYGFAKPASFDEGSRHGVFKFDRSGTRVVDFFQKEPPEFLKRNAALADSRSCGLDTGIIGFSPAGVERLLDLGQREVRTGVSVLDALREGTLSLDLYSEILLSTVGGETVDGYLARLAGKTAPAQAVLHAVFDALHSLELRGFIIRRPRFLHFGSLMEYAQSCAQLILDDSLPFYSAEDAELRPLMTESLLVHNSHACSCAAAAGARDIYVEGCEGTRIERAGGRNLFVGLADRTFTAPVPAGICIDERRTAEGAFLLTYGLTDTWGKARSLEALIYCGARMCDWLSARGLDAEAVFPARDGSPGAPWDPYAAALYVPDAGEEFLCGYWDPQAADAEWKHRFLKGPRLALHEIAGMEGAVEREGRRTRVRAGILRDEILQGRGWLSVPLADFLQCFGPQDAPALASVSERTEDDLVRIYRSKLLASLYPDAPRTDTISGLRVDYLGGAPRDRVLARGVKSDQIVWARSPVRLDLAGGWTDTPPFTLREGGEVVNLAVNLNDQPPIQVFCRRTEERAIRIHSIDTGEGELIGSFEALEGFDRPGSSFALPKAALVLLGLSRVQTRSASLSEALEKIGCGVEITLLSAVPKGSGLGTSSILGGAILAALKRFFGLPLLADVLFREVLQMEQMLTTGGGWQDQIGGIVGGVKYIESRPGLRPDPVVYQLDPFLFQDPRSAQLFTLYYTGATRLAKSILQDVVDRVNGMDPSYLYTLRSLKTIARAAREAISLRDLYGLGRALDASWQANKRIHPSTTNDEVEALLRGVRDGYAGMKLLGAGGGGFVLFLSDTVQQAEGLRTALARSENDRARVVGMSLNASGLEVTVS
jgi:galactokinase/mevalonate kinase-like predicted kinase